MDIDKRFSPDLTWVAKEKSYYALTMFPYPSGAGLHCGHASVFTINDVVARYKRMQWYTVLNPFGFDAFGLPTENYAIQQGKPARDVTDINKQHFLDQVKSLNMSFDMERIIDTSEPEYYKWTQWIFCKLYEAGLAYKDTLWVNRCTSCMTVLANDQVVEGKCERCKSEIIQKKHPQWFIKITDYADRLIADLDTIDRPEETKIAQRNRIGRSEWAEIDFTVANPHPSPLPSRGTEVPTTPPSSSLGEGARITCFTTRPDTIYGVTAIVLAPESTMLDDLLDADHLPKVQEYRQKTLAKTAVQRQKDLKEKTGVNSGLFALHPLTQEKLPIRYADYVLSWYGSGAVMSVPAHDARDHEFAKKFGLEVKQVIKPEYWKKKKGEEYHEKDSVYAIIRNKEWKFLVVSSPSKDSDSDITPSYSFPWWTIESNEDILEWITREIIEETWYNDIAFSPETIAVKSYYYARDKKLYRENNANFIVGELSSESNSWQELDANESWFWIDIHRLDEKDIFKKIEEDNYFSKMLHIYLGNETIREWVLINSKEFDWLPHLEAQTKIINHLESQWVGRKKVTYKLRDRSVSRQRYWGSPVPIIYQEEILDVEHHEKLKMLVKELRTIAQSSWWDFALYSGLAISLSTGKHYRNHSDIDGIFTWDNLDTFKDALIENWYALLEQTGLYPMCEKDWIEIEYADFTTFKDSLDEGLDIEEAYEEVWEYLILWWTAQEDIKVYMSKKRNKSKDLQDLQALRGEVISKATITSLVPESELPVVLPLDLENYKPTGKSPLEDHPEFPKYGDKWTRECDTLDTFMCSSFYFLRFPDAHNDDELIWGELRKSLLPVDFYTGGKEHTVGHLLYSRFIHKFLFDQWFVDSPEPFTKLVHQGMVLGEDGRKMGKRYGNGIDPTEVVDKYCADALRTYLMFMWPVESDKPWSDTALNGVAKFLKRVDALLESDFRGEQNDAVESILQETIKWITYDIENLKLNTCVSKLMILVNTIYEHKAVTDWQLSVLAQLLAPFATDLADKIWESVSGEGDVQYSVWPVADESKILVWSITLPVQVNGKVRAKIEIWAWLAEDEVQVLAKWHENIAKWIEGKEIVKVIWVQDKILNLIVK